ncbi:MAG: DUF916 domain-containing protein [Candidatus Dormibacteraeota bacterium]|nr:DUF916 domain-containing protein [Candidatus Dormibacteraeota bacterium]
MTMVACRRLAAAGAACAGIVLVASPVGAANGAGAPAVRPVPTFPHGYIEYSLAPSAQASDSIRVGDQGDTAGTFNMVAVDGFTSDLSGVVYGDATSALHDGPTGNGEYGAGRWITLSPPKLTLQPGQQTTAAYTVQVPAGTHAGDYVGGISAENPVPTAAPPSGQGVGLNITQRSVIAVVVHVPGQLTPPNFKVGKPTIAVENQRRQVVTFPLTYGGDTLIKPHLVFSIADSDGKLLLHFDQQLDTFVPHTTIHYPFPIDSTILPPGTYRITGTFGSGGPGDAAISSSIAVTAAAAKVPPPDQRSGPPPQAAITQTPGWVRSLLFGIGGLLLIVLALPVVLWWRRRCSHCARHILRGLILVEDFHEIADCAPCRGRALKREEVHLCQACYRSHVLARREAPPERRTRLSA